MKFKSYGFALSALVFSSSAFSASFDCAKATTNIEKMICSSTQLSELDSELSSIYKSAFAVDKSIKQDQLIWIKERNKCSNVECLKEAYEDRFTALQKFVLNSGVSTEPAARDVINSPQGNIASTTKQVAEDDLPASEANAVKVAKVMSKCAGFYSRWAEGASFSNCKYSDPDSILKCRAFVTNTEYNKFMSTGLSSENGKAYFLAHKSVFQNIYSKGANEVTNTDTSKMCINLVERMFGRPEIY